MAKEKDAPEKEAVPEAAEDAPRPLPKPIGTVRRTLVRPDGKEVSVDVPVYPPFRLEGEPQKPPPRRPRKGAKPRATGSD